MKKNIILLSFIMVSFVFLSSCTSPYIGRKVRPNQIFCKKTYGECSGKARDFFVTYSILKDGDEYEVHGEAKWIYGKTKTGNTYRDAIFTIYLIENSIVVQAVPVAGGSGGLDSPITFRRKFKSNGFTSSTIGYSIKTRG